MKYKLIDSDRDEPPMQFIEAFVPGDILRDEYDATLIVMMHPDTDTTYLVDLTECQVYLAEDCQFYARRFNKGEQITLVGEG